MKRGVEKFFRYARLRHEAYHAKMAGKPRGQQSRDPVIGGGTKFTNVFRELDRTTVWFREKVRDPLRDKPEVLLATVLFRLLNRIEVGEAIFCQTLLPSGRFKNANRPLTAWDAFHASGDVEILRHAVISAIPNGPHATGAYIISSPPGYTKLNGILKVVGDFYKGSHYTEIVGGLLDANWRSVSQTLIDGPDRSHCTLEETWKWLKQFDYFGPFHSYEIVTDLRHTALLCNAVDINTWANPGPGARRGLNWVHGREVGDHFVNRDGMIEEMRELLEHSRNPKLWPCTEKISKDPLRGNFNCAGEYKMFSNHWPAWEMREVEHTLCEFDKWCRVAAGGRTRGVYR